MKYYYWKIFPSHWKDITRMVEENYADGYDENDVLVMAMHHHSTIEQIKISNPNHKKIIIYQLEPLLSKDHWWSEEFIISRIKDADEVWDYDLDNIKILREHGINAKFKPFIYAESLKRVENKEEPDIDVFFYGTPTEHRSKILEIISNCGVFNEDSPSPSAPCVVTGFNLTKQSLDEFISRSKIIIDLQDNHLFKKSPDEFIQKQSRIYYALINNKCVVSEKSKRNYYGDLIIEAEKDDLLEKIIYLLNEDRWKSYSNVSERFKNLTHYQVLKNSLHPQNYFYAQESKPKIAVVTASIGTKDIKDPPLLFDNTDFYAFVDESKLNVKDSWKRNKFLDFSLDAVYKNRRNAKIYKVLPHLFIPDYDYYIWIDSTHYVAMDPNKIIEDLLSDSDIAVFKHPERDCVYEEAAFVKEINYDHHHLIDSVIDLYQNQNYPRNSGLYENPARIQRNTPEIQKLMLSWWEMICNYTSRDQITFPYALKQNNIIPAIIPGLSKRVNQNEYFPMYEESDHNRQF